MIKGKLFAISGPSGAGKGTICNSLAKMPEVALSVSKTSRSPRPKETEGRSYFFITEKQFREEIAQGEFLEYAEVHGNFYGTPRKWVSEKLDKGISVILEIDVQGALKVKEQMPQVVLVFILPPNLDELRKRIEQRGTESEEDVKRRLDAAIKEMSYMGSYDYCIVNDDLEKAKDHLRAILIAERSRVNEDNINTNEVC